MLHLLFDFYSDRKTPTYSTKAKSVVIRKLFHFVLFLRFRSNTALRALSHTHLHTYINTYMHTLLCVYMYACIYVYKWNIFTQQETKRFLSQWNIKNNGRFTFVVTTPVWLDSIVRVNFLLSIKESKAASILPLTSAFVW